jgi:hypothetical protein
VRAGLAAHDDDGARRVVHAVLADRTEQGLGQAAMSPVAHDEQVRAPASTSTGPACPSTTRGRTTTSVSIVHISVIASVRMIRAS